MQQQQIREKSIQQVRDPSAPNYIDSQHACLKKNMGKNAHTHIAFNRSGMRNIWYISKKRDYLKKTITCCKYAQIFKEYCYNRKTPSLLPNCNGVHKNPSTLKNHYVYPQFSFKLVSTPQH